jgi:hypothetical protein
VLPVVILPAPGNPAPSPTERTVWLHTCVDLYVGNAHLLELDNQILDVPDLATVLFQCSANPVLVGPVIGLIPAPVIPGQPPAAANQTVYTHLPVTG